MRSSVSESTLPQEHVESYLRQTMPHCKFTHESVISGYPPLILMWMTHNIAAFAFEEGGARESYDRLYGRFRDYYARNRGRLDVYDLSFVYCVRPDFPDLDLFRSEVETDVYFCRKFVVPLVPPLGRSFERLPFLPLIHTDGGPPRPPSAQSYMRECGVPAVLARYLSVPHQRGPMNIVRDCVEPESNWTPELTDPGPPTQALEQNGREVETVRLRSLSIENFRAYRKAQVFDLGTAITVLYGPNGFGKTSIFDAIDFAATGGVGRLGLSASTDRFRRAVTHLDSKAEDAVVSLSFDTNGVSRRLTRRVKTRMYANLDNAVIDRKKALVELTGGGITLAERIENLVSLFRATHLFSQDHQELARGFDQDCALPTQVVSHMLAFEDYAYARSKGSDVCEILQQRTEEARWDIRNLTGEIEDLQGAVLDLSKRATDFGKFVVPHDDLVSLRSRMKKAGLTVREQGSDRVFVRACRAAIQAKLAQGEARIARFNRLSEHVTTLPTNVEAVASLVTRRERLEAELSTTRQNLIGETDEQKKGELIVSELYDRRRSATILTDALVWAREIQPRYVKLLYEEKAMARAMREGSAEFDKLHRLRSEATVALTRQAEGRHKSTTRIHASRELTTVLDELARTERVWREDQLQVRVIDSEIEGCLATLQSGNADDSAMSSKLEQYAIEQRTIEREIAKIEQNSSNLSQLLSRVEDYLYDGTCPLCGHDHGSLSVLLREIRQRRVEDRAADRREELIRLRSTSEGLEQQRRDIRRVVDEYTARVEQLKRKRADRGERIVRFEKAATRGGVPSESMDATAIGEAVSRLQARVRKEAEEEEGRNRVLQDELEQTRVNMSDLDVRIGEVEQETNETRIQLQNLQHEITQLRDDHRADRVSLDSDLATLEELEIQYREQIKSIDQELEEAGDAVKKRREVANTHRQRISTLSSSIDDLRREIDTRQAAVAEARTLIIESEFDVDAEGNEIVRRLDEEMKTNGRLSELRDFADSVEIAMDTATTAAALEQQWQMIRQKKRRVTEVEGGIRTYELWHEYFQELTRRVSARQSDAIAKFAIEYGPMASALQQRLRSVYGFQGIETGGHDATIRVRVRRGEEILRPTDYFSHSQQHTLLLGLFLTACMSQTWSSLATVLLDDPIIHFDDLNTYAFLDMIMGFLGADSGPQQFIMSTCDQNVFQLARSKFRQLGKEARFYSFSALGPDGPVVKEIAPA